MARLELGPRSPGMLTARPAQRRFQVRKQGRRGVANINASYSSSVTKSAHDSSCFEGASAARPQDRGGDCWDVDGRGYGGGSWGGEFGGAFARQGPDYLWPERSSGGSRRGYELLCTGGHGYHGAGVYVGVPARRVRHARHGRSNHRTHRWFKRAIDKVSCWLGNKEAGQRRTAKLHGEGGPRDRR
jgi:hypothetical protein